MSFALTEDQELIRKTIRELAQGAIAKRAVEADLKMRFPRENVESLAQLGLLGALVSAEDGGAGADAVTFAIACEELGAACATTGAFTAVTNAWLTWPIAKWGTDAVKSEWLPKLISGQALGTYGLYEDAVGADPFRVRSSARPKDQEDQSEGVTEGDAAHEVGPATLSGTKSLTLLTGLAELSVVVARRGGDNAQRRVDAYVVPSDREGVIWGSDESKLGLRGYPSGPLYLQSVELDPEDLLGAPGQGPEITRLCNQLQTIGTAACAVGLARAGAEAAAMFANEREQFGVPIGRFEAIQHHIANQRIGADAARNMVLHAAAIFDKEGEAYLQAEEANVHAFEQAKTATRMAIRTHGGMGFMRDLPVERYSRDVRTLAVLGRGIDTSRTLIGLHELRMDAT